MKKILFIGLSAFLTYAAQAQENNQSIIFEKSTNRLTNYETNDSKLTLPTGLTKAHQTTNGKKTRAQDRWYSHVSAVDTMMGGNGAVIGNNSGVRIWHDSTVKQVFTGGAGTVNYSSYYNTLDPMAPVFNDPAAYGGLIQVGATDVYTVDTVVVYGAYVRPKGGNPDTLIISLVKNSANQATNDILYYNPGKTAFPEMLTNNYVSGIGGDTLMSMQTMEADSIRSIAVNTNQSYVFKKVLTNADTSSFITPFVFTIPTPLQAEIGRGVGVSVTFRSGNSWVANVDTISNLNNFIGVFSEEQTGLAQEYRGNAPDFDLNMSGLMFSWVRDSYYPSFFIEGWNTVAFDKEIAWVDYHVNCPTCKPVGINDISSNISSTVAPNPASDNVRFTINLVNAAKEVSISMTNLLGQQVKNVKVGAVSANNAQSVNVNVADLASGVYIYTIQADGAKASNKILVK